jgi:hypothetical protein
MRQVALLVAGILTGASTSVAAGYDPKINYQLQCMGCHLADGRGVTGRVPSVRTTLMAFSAVPAGRDFVMRVPGVAQSPLSDAEVAALLNWMVRNLSDLPLPAGFVDYSAAEVTGARHRPLSQVSELRRQLQCTLAGQCPDQPNSRSVTQNSKTR